ncbi:sporulation stage III protein AG [Anaerosalibacter sp. Marseille-P3206]|uniref:sporulation stage III protein AG n=1 Tax=Anaerosalibacter sp. Marseille-P3206 TaxID=1871005 RepID=UPI0009872884|nr:sporulation stage III protein AG [Anaerosalibacter sp. Marseille-P3206]
MNFKEKLKELSKKITDKKYINNLLIIFIVGIIILIATSIFNDNVSEKETNKRENKNEKSSTINFTEDYGQLLERRLENILSEIKGAGKVKVMITLEETSEKVPATNSNQSNEKTSEKDSQGGVRDINREDSNVEIATKGSDGSLIVLKEIEPNVKGVIVVAEGAFDMEVKEKLYQAVKTVLGVSGNRVEVYSSK